MNKIFTSKRDTRIIPTDSWANLFHIAEYPLSATQNTDISNIFNSLTVKGDFLNNLDNIDVYHVQQKDTWESISNNVYGTADLWWLVMVTNEAQDPFEELVVNTRIRDLKGSVVDEVLFRIEKNRLDQ